jgi:transposase
VDCGRPWLFLACLPQAHLEPGLSSGHSGKRNEAPVACPSWIYTNRNLVERLWSRLKEWRAVATRYEKTERSFMGVLCMAATMDWLKA